MSEWQTYIDHAAALGFTVQHNPEFEGWTVITPARPRKPSQELGAFKDSRSAWRGAARLALEYT